VVARAAWQYQGASIYSYGDGSATPSGDNRCFPHTQIDASVTLGLTRDVAMQLQALNLNNAVFGFYNGIPGTEFSNQREYSWSLRHCRDEVWIWRAGRDAVTGRWRIALLSRGLDDRSP
jgi:hypothetical protein